jgi:hypothetical protein
MDCSHVAREINEFTDSVEVKLREIVVPRDS